MLNKRQAEDLEATLSALPRRPWGSRPVEGGWEVYSITTSRRIAICVKKEDAAGIVQVMDAVDDMNRDDGVTRRLASENADLEQELEATKRLAEQAPGA